MINNTSKQQVLDSCTFSENHNDPCTYKEPIKYLLQFRIFILNHMCLRVDSVSCYYYSIQKSKQNLWVGSHQNQITTKERIPRHLLFIWPHFVINFNYSTLLATIKLFQQLTLPVTIQLLVAIRLSCFAFQLYIMAKLIFVA